MPLGPLPSVAAAGNLYSPARLPARDLTGGRSWRSMARRSGGTVERRTGGTYLAQPREILWLDPESLELDPTGVRQMGTDDELEGLAATIREFGILQPLGVRRDSGRYRVVYGSRRRAAAILAGVTPVPCVEIVKPLGEGNGVADHPEPGHMDGPLAIQLLENVQRRDLTDLEKAEGFASLRAVLARSNTALRDSGLDDMTARTLGISVRTLQRYLRLLDLPAGVRRLIASGDLSVTQAQHLRVLGDPDRQEELARVATERGLPASVISRASGVLARQPGLDVDEAVAIAVRGDQVPDIRQSQPEPVRQRIAPAPKATSDSEDSDADLWPEDRDPDGFEDGPGKAVATADGHRVFRIRTVDAFCDDVARLARSLQDGDLAKAIEQDEASKVKLPLARRQIGYVAGELQALLDRHGWR